MPKRLLLFASLLGALSLTATAQERTAREYAQASGPSPALLTNTGRNAFDLEEYELLTKTPVTLPSGNVWFDVQPNCTNSNDPTCTSNPIGAFESDTDGLNGINSKFTVTSDNGMGPTYHCLENIFCGDAPNWASWCYDADVACGDGLSAGLLK